MALLESLDPPMLELSILRYMNRQIPPSLSQSEFSNYYSQ